MTSFVGKYRFIIKMKNQKGNEGTTSALYLWNGLTAFWGTSFHTDPHSHDSLQLVFDIDKEFMLKDESSDWSSFSSAIIKTSHIHQLDSNKSIQLFIYLDKDCAYSQKLIDKFLPDKNVCGLEKYGITKTSTNFFKKLLVNTDCEKLFEGILKIVEQLIDLEPQHKRDNRISKAVKFIESAEGTLKVQNIAEHVSLSESRLRFLFKKEVGQSIQSFMLWMKVINSVNSILKGEQLTQTAYSVGFWDVAHMNRSFKELLGVAPSAITKYEKELKVIVCEKINFYNFKTEILTDWLSDKPYRTVEI
tara:strand:+ start:1294 stop:2205 length:912 start_codon:yes stop_codon:yes gene_type:complete